MSGAWTHAQCWYCWEARNGTRTPHVLMRPEWENCCFCGNATKAGIYVRADPAALDHCQGHDD